MNHILVSLPRILCMAVLTGGFLLVSGAGSDGRAAQDQEDASESAFSQDQRAELEDYVRDFLLDNPEVLMESMRRFQQEQQEQKRQEQAANIKQYEQTLYDPDVQPSVGPEDAAVKIVEFFDYNCGYCKKALDGVMKVIENQDDVQILFREFPILSQSSKTAAYWALAAHEQGKYLDYHTALMEHRGPKTASALKKIGKDLGLDIEKLEADAGSDAIKAQVQDNIELARKIGVTGTPGFVINGELTPGFMPYEQLKAEIARAREESGK